MQELFLGKDKASSLARCPRLRGLPREGSTFKCRHGSASSGHDVLQPTSGADGSSRDRQTSPEWGKSPRREETPAGQGNRHIAGSSRSPATPGQTPPPSPPLPPPFSESPCHSLAHFHKCMGNLSVYEFIF